MTGESVRPITTTLIRRALLWAVLCTLVFGGLQAGLTYRTVQERFQIAVRNVAKTQVQLLSFAVWDVDDEAIQRQVNLLTESPSIGFAVVQTGMNRSFESGQREAAAHADPLVFQISRPGHASESIGTLKVVINTGLLSREIARSVAFVLLQCLVLTGLILGAVVKVLRGDLQAPVKRLAAFVNGLKAHDLSVRMDLARAPGHARDELDLLAEGFQTLQARIQQHIATLDIQVAERTRQLNEALTTLKLLSTTDPLTGCYNRTLFNERFPGELGRAQRYVRPLSIIFCDVDRFKSVNDTYGHGTGDRVLAEVGKCLLGMLRVDVDWVVRYGGEEFVMVLPETSLADACGIAERLRLEVMRGVRVTLADGSVLGVTASLGVAEQLPGEAMASLLHRADEHLYAAKAGGRNQVRPALDPATPWAAPPCERAPQSSLTGG